MKNRTTLPIVLIAAVLFLSAALGASAQVRTKISLNNDWRFLRSDAADAQLAEHNDASWEKVNLPHTWNAKDVWDDEPGYYRGPTWYRKAVNVVNSNDGKRRFLYFEGANQVTEVYVNGTKAGSHIGGYSAFVFDVTGLLKSGSNQIAVLVDNTFNEDIPPLTADFTFFGGIYRDVWLITASDVHFTMTDHASPGITITTPDIEKGSGVVSVKGSLTNASATDKNVEVASVVLDKNGRRVASSKQQVTASAGKETAFSINNPAVKDAKLWSPDSPYLYTVKSTISVNGKTVDELTQPLGFRWFRFDPDKGFFINGNHLKMLGTNRHQDHAGLGNALPDRLHVRDIELIKDAGFNFVRLAHYPQDPSVLEACDRIGLLVWEETPLVNYITDSPGFTENSKLMVREMIRQHRNHPSVVLWGYMNEIYLRVPKGSDHLYPKTVVLARELDRVAKEEDPTRPTAIAFHGNAVYNTTGLGDVPDVIGWNLYQGWYSGELLNFGKFMDDQHKAYPKRPLVVSEYGANGDPRLHSEEPVRFDSTIKYQQIFHSSYLAQINARPYISGSAMWNQFDFSSEYRGETIPHLNQKGLYYYDRTPKDIHYFYKANLSAADILHIAVRDRKVRAGDLNRSYKIDVFSNAEEVELFVNGASAGKSRVDDLKQASFDVKFKAGKNTLEAVAVRGGKKLTDKFDVEFRPVRADAKNIFINVGSNADFTDADGNIWVADLAATNSFWMASGGDLKRNISLSTDPNILDTELDAVFQTNVEGLSEYKLNVPDGRYRVELLFTEKRPTEPGKRVFSVTANGSAVITDLDIYKESGEAKALFKRFEVDAKGGIVLGFKAKTGRTILSGIRLERLR